MGLFGNLIKGVVNVAIAPVVIVKDVVTGDFESTADIIENVIDATSAGVDDLSNGDLI